MSDADDELIAVMSMYGYGATAHNGGYRCACALCMNSREAASARMLTAAERRKRLITIDGGQP
jgi:hypothetical protein